MWNIDPSYEGIYFKKPSYLFLWIFGQLLLKNEWLYLADASTDFYIASFTLYVL